MSVLEKYEWTRTWWDEPAKDEKRVLLIGDSISFAYREFVKAEFGDKLYIDLISTSHAVDNENYLLQVKYMLGIGKYNCIHFNNGLHGFHLSTEEYSNCYEKVLCEILEYGVPVILVLSTPTAPKKENNHIVIERNGAVLKLAEKYNLPVNDMYSPSFERLDEIQNPDGVHYNSIGTGLHGKWVANALKKELNI